MIDALLMRNFLNSELAVQLLQSVQAHGLTADQAIAAVKATAKGARQYAPTSMLTGVVGGLGPLAEALLGKTASGAALADAAGPIAQFVATKTGLAPATAQRVVSLALPYVEKLLHGSGNAPVSSISRFFSLFRRARTL